MKERFEMTEILGEEKLNQTLKSQSKVIVMFYATWCPYSQKFLPIYVKCTAKNPFSCIRIAVDDLPELCIKYAIDVYPTVIFFQNGNIAKRLDGMPGAGLTENQLRELLESC